MKVAVLQQIGTFKPDVKEMFEDEADAVQFAKLLKKNHPNHKYFVAEIKEEL